MKRVPLSVRWSLLAALAVAGCESTSQPADGGVAQGDAATPLDASSDAPFKPSAVTLSVRFIDAATRDPLVGVRVCAAERDEVPCSTTRADGGVTIALPADSELMLACTIETHAPMYMTLKTPAANFDVGIFRLIDKKTAAAFVVAAGAPEDPARGIVLANVYDELERREQRVADATFTLDPAEGTGPVYGGAIGVPVPGLTGSTTGGPGMFFNLSPGNRTVKIAHPSRRCVRGFGWPTPSETSIRTKVYAGGLSTVTFVCPP